MEVQKDFREFLALLNAHDVKFVIVGGYALAYHGAPLKADKRANGRTKDLSDIEALGDEPSDE
jgi:hypothetical protein